MNGEVFFYSPSDSFIDRPRDPYINRNLLPIVFDGKVIDDLSVKMPPPLFKSETEKYFHLPPIYLSSEKERYIDSLRRSAFRYLLNHRVDLVKYTQDDLPTTQERIEEVKPNVFQTIFKVEYEPEKKEKNVELPGRFRPKTRYWVRSGSSFIQFQSQNYISKDWYENGSGTLNLLSVQEYSANYKKDKIIFNNAFSWRLSFFNSPNDTLRMFRIGEDLFRYYGDFGLRAFNDKWYYSSFMEVKTQILTNHQENTTNVMSSILSPVWVNVGFIGMKYQHEKKFPKNKYKKATLSVDVSPLSINYVYVASDKVDPKRFSIDEGLHHNTDFGTTVNANLNISFNRDITFTSRFKLFSNYEKTIIESENTLKLILNRYFSTTIYFYPRFDDSPGVKKEPKLGYWKINETITFGFNFKW